MSAPLSKRQQARNERVLQDLIKTVPGNNVCADCQARNPGWASWNLGIFLCMRCAALHRKLGTHITKVKSLSMDSWSHEQVETMKRIGNHASNRVYNASNARAPITFDISESDAAMERYIRLKYQEKVVKASQVSSVVSHNSDDKPPPLPPKTGTKAGLRSSSSTPPLSSIYKKDAIPHQDHQSRFSLRRNKPSRVFGITVEGSNDYENKNIKLCEMGFTDQVKNMAVLKDLGGDLEKSIETLVHFGENDAGATKHGEKPQTFRSVSTPTLPEKAKTSSFLNGCKDLNSFNPFSPIEAESPSAQPQSSQSTGVLQSQIRSTNTNYGQQVLGHNGVIPCQSSSSLAQSFQRMNLNKSQSLFPNRTGPGFPGVPTSQTELPQQSLTPPVPCLPQQYHHGSVYFQEPPEPPPKNTNFNPFFQSLPQEPLPELANNNIYSNNYYPTSYSIHQNSHQGSSMQQYPPPNSDYSVQQPRDPSNPYQSYLNPFTLQQSSTQNNLQSQALPQIFNVAPQIHQIQPTQQQVDLVMPRPSMKADTKSILDLFNYPHLAPNRPLAEQNGQTNQTACFSEKTHVQISAASSSLSNKNPFATDLPVSKSQINGDLAQTTPPTTRNLNQENLGMDAGGWMNGRHSPDAWRSISARSMR